MFGIPLTGSDIETAIQAFMSIEAVTPVLAAVLGIGLVGGIVAALRSIVTYD